MVHGYYRFRPQIGVISENIVVSEEMAKKLGFRPQIGVISENERYRH